MSESSVKGTRKKIHRKPAPQAPVCSFCDAREEDGVEILYRHPVQGPFICEQCVWKGVATLQESEEQAAPDVYVMDSKIHGRGLFAGERISKGSYVGTYSGPDDVPLTRHNERYAIFSYDAETGEETGWRVGTTGFRFLNHSDDPNLEMDENFHFYARKPIKKDDELTWYYGDDFSNTVPSKKSDRG